MKPGTRAVGLQVAAGTVASCIQCQRSGKPSSEAAIKFRSSQRQRWVIANVYASARDPREPGTRRALPPGRSGVWDRVETFHDECYTDAGEPYGQRTERPNPQKRPEPAEGEIEELSA